MQDHVSGNSKTLTIVALLASLVPVIITVLWTKAFNLGGSQEERVAIFKSYFPEFLQGRWDTTYLSIVFCIIAIAVAVKTMKSSFGLWRALNIIILTISGALLFLNLFSMM